MLPSTARAPPPDRWHRAARARRRRRRCRRPRLPRVERLDRTGVDDHRAGNAAAGPWPVIEPPPDRGGGLGIVGEHGILPRPRPHLGAEPRPQLRQQLGVGGLGAPSPAEDRPDERRHGDDVVDGGGRLVDPVGRPVGVDAVGLGLGVRDDLAPLVTIGLDEETHLVRDELLCGRARDERLTAGHQAEGVDARDVGDGRSCRASTELEQQAPVAGGHPTGAEGEVGASPAGNVSDAVFVVEDRRAGATGGLLAGGAHRRKVLREEVRIDVGVRDGAAQRRECVVERDLVARFVGGGQAAVVAGRKDVEGAVRCRRFRWTGLPTSRRRNRRTQGHGHHDPRNEVTRSDAHTNPPECSCAPPSSANSPAGRGRT